MGWKMTGIRWKSVFSQCFPQKGATRKQLDGFVSSVCGPLSEAEIVRLEASQRNPFRPADPLHSAWKSKDPRKWRLPAKPLPHSYLSFLRWSNGGEFVNGDRTFSPVFGTRSVRDYLLSYMVPEYMPGSLPFALDGGGCFFLFDMRDDPVDGEYPVLFVGCGNLGYDDAVVVAGSFTEACEGKTDPRDLYME
jgi:hypothetical protein